MAAKQPAPKGKAKPTPAIEALIGDRDLTAWETALERIGARLCYGDPVQADGRTVIPVATVEAAGGMGIGRGSGPAQAPTDGEGEGSGGGGGGWVQTMPVGYIEISAEGTRFRRIIDPLALSRALVGGVVKSLAVWVWTARARRHSG